MHTYCLSGLKHLLTEERYEIHMDLGQHNLSYRWLRIVFTGIGILVGIPLDWIISLETYIQEISTTFLPIMYIANELVDELKKKYPTYKIWTQ